MMMSEDDPFADLDEMADPDDSNDVESPDPDDGLEENSTADELAEPVDPLTEPAFPFDEALQRPLYAREESWDEFEDICDFEVKRLLRDDDIKDISGRELHDATLRLAASNPEALADEVRKLRGLDDE